MKKKVLTVLLGMIIPGVVMIFLFTDRQGEPAQMTFQEADQKEIRAIVSGAVEDNTWWYAGSEEEVSQILARYYTNPLLAELSADAWQFIREPTDWYWLARVKKMQIEPQKKECASVTAELEITDSTTGEVKQGKAGYALKKTKEGWRIFFVLYQWSE